MNHKIGDIVACYNNAIRSKITIGWITEIVHETIYIADVDHQEERYRVQWADSDFDDGSIILYTPEEISDGKNLYISWHNL